MKQLLFCLSCVTYEMVTKHREKPQWVKRWPADLVVMSLIRKNRKSFKS